MVAVVVVVMRVLLAIHDRAGRLNPDSAKAVDRLIARTPLAALNSDTRPINARMPQKKIMKIVVHQTRRRRYRITATPVVR